MSYTELVGLVLGGWACGRFHMRAPAPHHSPGHVSPVSRGWICGLPAARVIFAVLLAFVFNNVWSDYNVAAQAIDSECASLHGIAILSDRLPSPARNAILDDLHAYLTTILDREWPDMQRRNESRAAGASFQSLWQTVETVNTDPADNQI